MDWRSPSFSGARGSWGSDMPEIHIPLQHGQHEDIDAKMLPQGAMLQVRNARLRRDNRYGLRYGYVNVLHGNGTAIASGNFGDKRSVYVTARTGAATSAQWFDHREDGIHSSPAVGSSVGDLGVPRRVAAARNLKYDCLACDMVQVGSYIFSVYQDASYTSGTISGVTLAIHEAVGNRLIDRRLIATTAAVNPKITSIGTTVMVVWADTGTDDIGWYSVNSSTLSFAGGIITSASGGRGFSFDIAPLDGTRMLLAYETSAVNLRWSTVTAAGVATAVVNQAIAFAVRPSLALGSSGNVVMCWAEGAAFNTGSLHYRVDTTAGASVVAKTTLDSSGAVVGYPVAGLNTTHDYTLAWINSSSTKIFTKTYSVRTVGWLVPVSKPFMGPNNACLMWTVNYTFSGQTDQFGTYKLIDCESPEALAATTVGAVCEAVTCQQSALPGAYQNTTATYQWMIDPRRSCVSTTTVLSRPGTTAFAVLLPVAIANGFGADIVRMDNGLYVDRLLPCNINGQLLFTGPRVREFDGSIFYESGFADGPELVSLTDGGVGTATGGTVQVVVTYEWQDAQGRRHRSPPSVPKTITVVAGHNIGVDFSRPAFSDRSGGLALGRGIYAMIWRTLNGGTVFYLDNYATGRIAIPSFGASTTSYSITTLDAAIATQEILYTQGARGGASGLLANDEPPPCRYMWAGNDRVIMAGLEDPSAYRFSKLIFPGEPLQFSNDDAFKGHVDAETTACACMDGIWYVFTADAIFAITGDGPDDTGDGFFAEPRRVSSLVGCISHRSIVEIAEGLLFHASNGQIWLLPRGGGPPSFFGAPMRDTLFDLLIMGAQRIRGENLVAWLAITTSATAYCAIIIYDSRASEWMYDYSSGGGVWASPRSTLDRYNDKLVIDGYIAETAAFIDDHTGSNGVAYYMELHTGDVRPFGPNGHGRVRKAVLLGEARSTATIIAQILVSYDSGVSYADDASSVFTYTGSVSNPIQIDHLLKYPRGNAPSVDYSNSFRFKLLARSSSATAGVEAFAFNALSLEIYPERGLARQRSAMRV